MPSQYDVAVTSEQPGVLTDTLISKLAREIARRLRPPSEVRDAFGLTEAQFEAVLDTPFFKVRLAEEVDLWNASDAHSAIRRIGIKAATMIEESLPDLYAMILDPRNPMAAKVDALKTAARWAGIETNSNVTGDKGGSGGVKIIINMGQNSLQFEKERVLPSQVIDGEAVELTERSAS